MTDHRLEIVLAARDISKKGFDAFQNRIKAITGNIFSFQGAIATLAGTGGFGLLVKSSLSTADAIGKTADKLGISTKALQEYRFAAGQTGVAQNTLDMALQRFTRRAAEAYQGTGELKGILTQYGIAVADASGKMRRSEDIFADLADVIGKTESKSERLRIAFKAFDSEGAALVNMLSDGAEGIERFKAEAEALGLVIDERLIRDAETASDQLDVMGKVISANVTGAVLTLAPKITDVTTRMTDWVKANKGLIDQKVEETIDGIKDAVVSVYDVYKSIPEEITGAAGYGLVGSMLFGKKVGAFIAAAKLANDTANTAAPVAGKYAVMLAAAKDGFAELNDVISATPEEIDKMYAALMRFLKESQDKAGKKYKVPIEKNVIAPTKKAAETVTELESALYNVDAALVDLKSFDAAAVVSGFKNMGDALALGFSGSYIDRADDLLSKIKADFKKTWGFDFPEAVQAGADASVPVIDGISETYLHMIERVQDITAEMIRTAFDGEIKTVRDATEAMTNYLKDGMSEIASQALIDGKGIVGAFKEIFENVSAVISSIMSTNPYLLLVAGIVAGGYSLSESMGGGEARDTWSYVTGTGTVLGNAALESDSISRSLDVLNDVNEDSYNVLQGIRTEMIDLNANITGLVLNILHGSTGYNAVDLGVNVGKFQEGVFDSVSNAAFIEAFGGLSSLAFNWGQQLGGMFENLGNWLMGGGKKRELLSTGVQTGGVTIADLLAGGGVDTTGFERHRTTKSGLFGSSSSKIYSSTFDIDASVANMFDQLYESMGETMVEIARGLGTDNLEEVMGYLFDVSNIDLKDLTGEEISEKIAAWIGAEGDTAVEALFGELVMQYQRLDEGLMETAVRLISDKAGVLSALEKTNQSFDGTGQAMIAFSETIVSMAGDIQALQASVSAYYDAFFTENDKFVGLERAMADAFGALGISLPGTRKGFRDLVEGLDLTTDAGQSLYVSLLELSGAAGEYYKDLDHREETRNKLLIEELNLLGKTEDAVALSREMRRAELEEMDASLVPIQERIWALEDERSAVETATEAVARFGDTLEDRLSVQALQNRILGLGGDEIRMAEIATRYGWQNNGFASMNADGSYNWGVIAQNLTGVASMAGDDLPGYLSRIADMFGLSVETVIDDFGYLSDAVWDFRDAAKTAADEITGLYFSDLAPVQSAGMYESQLSTLFGAAGSGSSEDIQALFDFVKADYLPFYQSFTGGGSDYNTVFNDLVARLSQFTQVDFDLTATIENVGTTVASAIREVYMDEIIPLLTANGRADVTLVVNDNVLGDIVARQMTTNPNLIEAMGR